MHIKKNDILRGKHHCTQYGLFVDNANVWTFVISWQNDFNLDNYLEEIDRTIDRPNSEHQFTQTYRCHLEKKWNYDVNEDHLDGVYTLTKFSVENKSQFLASYSDIANSRVGSEWNPSENLSQSTELYFLVNNDFNAITLTHWANEEAVQKARNSVIKQKDFPAKHSLIAVPDFYLPISPVLNRVYV